LIGKGLKEDEWKLPSVVCCGKKGKEKRMEVEDDVGRNS
jgi:hypothetical protein